MLTINGNTRVFVIVADPVAQVKAPAMFNQVFARFGVNAVMVPLQVPAVALEGTLRSLLLSPTIGGVALSIPHKHSAASVCDTLTTLAAQAQAVNALRRASNGGLEGALFDGIGLLAALEQAGFAYHGKRVLIIGAGGAAAAIAASLHAHTSYLAFYDPDAERSRALSQRFSAKGNAEVTVARTNDPQGFDLVINASPLGMNTGDALPADPARMAKECKVFDIVMKSPATEWVRLATRYGLAASNGSAMLIRQMPAYLRFFGYPELALAVEEDEGLLNAM